MQPGGGLNQKCFAQPVSEKSEEFLSPAPIFLNWQSG